MWVAPPAQLKISIKEVRKRERSESIFFICTCVSEKVFILTSYYNNKKKNVFLMSLFISLIIIFKIIKKPYCDEMRASHYPRRTLF